MATTTVHSHAVSRRVRVRKHARRNASGGVSVVSKHSRNLNHAGAKKKDVIFSTDYSALVVGDDGEPQMMIQQEDDDAPASRRHIVYRFDIPRLYVEDGRLVTQHIHESKDLPHPRGQYDEWFTKSLDEVANSVGTTKEDLVKRLTSDNPAVRSSAYEDIGGYHGFDNFDSYPDTWSEKKMAKDWP